MPLLLLPCSMDEASLRIITVCYHLEHQSLQWVFLINLVGKPIPVPKIENPSLEQILEYQKKYLDGLQDIYREYAPKYAPNDKKPLTFIE